MADDDGEHEVSPLAIPSQKSRVSKALFATHPQSQRNSLGEQIARLKTTVVAEIVSQGLPTKFNG